MGSLLLNVVPGNAADIDTLRASSIAFVLSPVPLVGNKPFLLSSGVVDAASDQPGAVTPGKIVVLYGAALGPNGLAQTSVGPDGRIANSLGGTQVLFDGIAAPLLYTSNGQVGAVAPYELDGKLGTQVTVQNGSLTSDPIALPVRPVGPSIFSANLSGSGPAAILNEDGLSVNSLISPAARGSVISIFATGEGQTLPGGVDGLVQNGKTLPAPVLPVKVTIDGQPAQVVYAGAAPGAVSGLLQVNVRVPVEASAGVVSIQIQVGDVASQPGMTVTVK
jgi:uncharacterized protein (TIGR03437 family)